VELLPVFQFDAQDCPPGKVNYWGYAPVSFFAPHQAYSSRPDPLGAVDELRDMVKALHRAGLEVILDVVYNHTAEVDQRGPTLCFRGFDNAAYYILEEDRSRYANYTGTGNTLNANHPIVRRMIVASTKRYARRTRALQAAHRRRACGSCRLRYRMRPVANPSPSAPSSTARRGRSSST
jgi:glycogen operon protein